MKNKYIFSEHLKKRIEERNLEEKWITETLINPDKNEKIAEDEEYFFKKIIEFADKCLKVVVNPLTNIVITAFFDRKMTKKNCK